jgi:hypothetical protein
MGNCVGVGCPGCVADTAKVDTVTRERDAALARVAVLETHLKQAVKLLSERFASNTQIMHKFAAVLQKDGEAPHG